MGLIEIKRSVIEVGRRVIPVDSIFVGITTLAGFLGEVIAIKQNQFGVKALQHNFSGVFIYTRLILPLSGS